ncbi:hypothetical protein M2323_000652 [Rhodoblastus acidophilus]|uniref:hypothetical protein n=1 Tax=Rhodoblastus acidophilus TaxID=1074 RepID=UPI00222576A8|nr:hypothetical protein [Rhodoblastus acidophilus]MCW2282887.1 hypothetical protein [Rhodoblastus acidophilus]MCW2331748.1 hypothetical protein [Rhodoblastus acidophilus]
MDVTRRMVLKSLGLGAAAAIVPDVAATAGGMLLLRAEKYRLGDLGAADFDWVESCLIFSEWHVDASGAEIFIRHRLSGLAYLLDRTAMGRQLIGIAPDSCPGRLACDPDGVVGHAAMWALLRGLGVARARRWPRTKPFVLVHQMFSAHPFVDPILREAGPIPIRLYPLDAAEA